MSENPLKKYSQRPGTYVTLPSLGKYYPVAPKLTADNELEVRPMTASDEIRLKNPDGLMNSESLFQVIEHVVPGIVDARDIPTPDLDVIIIAMRIATYGEIMSVGVGCKECSHNDSYEINLTSVIANARKIEAVDQIEIESLKINLRPHTSESNTMMSNYQVELVRAAKAFSAASGDDRTPLNQNLGEIMKRGGELLFNIAAKHIVSIITPDGVTVTDLEFIREWLTDLPAPMYQKIRDAVNELSQEVITRDMSFTCSKCEHTATVEVAFDPSNFFENSSL
jgi:hypothetical protein